MVALLWIGEKTKKELRAIYLTNWKNYSKWLKGNLQKALQQRIGKKCDFETFFAQAPQIHPNVSKITGVICGYRVEEIEDKLMQKIRYLDKLVDELAKGKTM